MTMTVDAARKHQLAARIDLAFGGAEAAANCYNGLARDGDIGLERIGGGSDAPSPDDQVVGGLGHDNLHDGYSRLAAQVRTPRGRALAPGA